jgi:hypothetical protein
MQDRVQGRQRFHEIYEILVLSVTRFPEIVLPLFQETDFFEVYLITASDNSTGIMLRMG